MVCVLFFLNWHLASFFQKYKLFVQHRCCKQRSVFAFSRPVRLHFSLESWIHCNTSIEFKFYAFVHEYFDFHDYYAVYINTLYNIITAIID